MVYALHFNTKVSLLYNVSYIMSKTRRKQQKKKSRTNQLIKQTNKPPPPKKGNKNQNKYTYHGK